MSAYALSPLALLDLSAIWDYSAERWGAEQADRYVRRIVAACVDLGCGRVKGIGAEAIREGYFKYPAGSHVLFYRLGDIHRVEIIRILHQRMDLGRHLLPELVEEDA
ncbi:MAG: type II toxin-antitoxin system RelE/ParE family toxin [Alphaproteobacteria bacterium]|nr:type II toxin-antitoxin system RelE/ParE family toxin [Alphaproteobacteria bacterium]